MPVPINFQPKRVISLIPSMTESLFDLGVGNSVVGVTDYCIHPEKKLTSIPRVGGPKSLNVDRIIHMKPDLVIANREENDRSSIETLMKRDIPVWLTFPKTVTDMMDDLWSITELFRNETAMITMQSLEKAIELAVFAAQGQTGFTYFCPIWQGQTQEGIDWWMTFNQDTYTSSLLQLFGGKNIFNDRSRRYPLEADLGKTEPEEANGRDIRYPRVLQEEILERQPDMIIFPDEPFPFRSFESNQFLQFFTQIPASKNGKIYWIDGSYITWPGTRIAKAILILEELLILPD